MNIDPATTFNMPGITSQNGLQANSNQSNSGPAVSDMANSRPKDNTLSDQKQNTVDINTSSGPAISDAVGGLAVDDDKNVVVRFYDSKGNVVAQYPPEDYLKMMKELKQQIENLFHTTA